MNGIRTSFWLIFLVKTIADSSGLVHRDERLYEGSACKLTNGQNGTCRTNCPNPEVIQNLGNICGYKKDEAIVCCPKAQRYRNIREACTDKIYSRIRDSRPRSSCFPPLYPAQRNEHPHMAVLGWKSQNGELDWHCGGSLIHPLYVLTAAHCLINLGRPPDVVRIGGIDLQNDSLNDDVLTFKVHDSFVHPNYTRLQNYNDIGLIQIDSRSSCGHDQIKSCLYLKKDPPRNRLLTMGYGAPEFVKSYNYKLYQGNLTLMETEKCRKHYSDDDRLPRGLDDSQICAFDPKNKIDTCQGDSGGPLLFDVYKRIHNETVKRAYLVGIVSFGDICLSGHPGVYTRIYSYLDWIESVLSRKQVEFTGLFESYTVFVS